MELPECLKRALVGEFPQFIPQRTRIQRVQVLSSDSVLPEGSFYTLFICRLTDMFFLPDVWEEGYWTALPNCIFSTTTVSVYDPLTFQHLGMFLYFRMTLLSESLSLLISHDLFSLLSGMSNKWCTQALCFLLAILQSSWPLYRCLGCHSLFLLGKFCHIETNTTVVDILASTALQKYWTQDCCSHSWREALKFSIYISIPTCVYVCIHYV